jgi:hypothetical protein
MYLNMNKGTVDVIIIIFFRKIIFPLDKIIYITLYIPLFLFFNIVSLAA